MTADVVAHDRLAPAAALELCRAGAELVDVGKQPDRHPLSQEEINALLVARAQAGRAVVRFKGGDPFVFGRGSEEALACRAAGVPFEVVPAVTSAIAAPAYAGIPVTHRGLAPAFAVVTGHEDPGKPEAQVDLEALARFPGTLVLLMGVGRLGAIADALVAHGKPASTPVALVRWGTTPRQEVVTGTLANIAEKSAGVAPPAVTVIGEVAALREELAWFDTRPLSGKRVLVPRTRHQASALSERLRALGAEPVEAPTIAITPARQPGLLRGALVRVRDGGYAWVGFTSANGVEAAWRALADLRGDTRWFAGGARGGGRARHRGGAGGRAACAPTSCRDASPRRASRRPCSRAGTRRASCSRAPIWRRRRSPQPCATPAGRSTRSRPTAPRCRHVSRRAWPTPCATASVDAIAFASSSTVSNLVTLLGGPPDPRVRIASIGPVTSQTCRDLGLRVDARGRPPRPRRPGRRGASRACSCTSAARLKRPLT